MKVTLIEYSKLLVSSGKVKAKILNVKYLDGINDIKKNIRGVFIIKNKGIFFEYSLNVRLFIDVKDILTVNLEDNIITISIKENEENYILKFTHEENAPIINMYNFIQKILPEDKKKDVITVETRTVEEYPYFSNYNPAAEKPKKITEKQRVKELKREHIPYCPKCHSTSLHYIENRKRLSIGRTIVGGAIEGVLTGGASFGAGAVLGGLSSSKMKKGQVKCLNCGHTWKL